MHLDPLRARTGAYLFGDEAAGLFLEARHVRPVGLLLMGYRAACSLRTGQMSLISMAA